jgi:HEAT repeat protein
MIQCLADENAAVVRSTVRALAKIGVGPESQAAVGPLIVALRDENPLVRTDAALLLGQIGPAARAAIIPLMDRAFDPTSTVVGTSARAALVKVSKGNVRALSDLLSDPNASHRSQAAGLLGKLGAEAEAAVSALIGTLKDADAGVRTSAVRALGEIGAPARQAVIPLIMALSEESLLGSGGNQAYYRVRFYAESLDKIGIGPDAKAAVPTLVSMLKIKDTQVRTFAARSLGRIGPAAKAAVPALAPLTTDSTKSVREAAAEALKQIDPALVK